jgi:hypothetical protein
MSRKPISHLVLALSIAAILPLELAQCAWMGIGSYGSACPAGASSMCAMGAAAPAGASHACCRAKSPGAPGATRRASGAASMCSCKLIPAGTLPAMLHAGDSTLPLPGHVALAIARDPHAPASWTRESVPAPDVGSAPLPSAIGAHLLRAPPLSV